MLFRPTFSHTFALALFLAAAQPAIASPIRLSHQGRMLDVTGAPLDGEHALTARLVADGGDVLWTDTVLVTLQHGYYHLILGDHAPLDDGLFRGGTPILELAVDDGPPMRVEGPLAHVPYAAVAEWARTADQAQRSDTAAVSDRATLADRATAADHADTATSAEQATSAAHANTADSASHADTATLAQRAETATVAEGFAGDALSLARLDAETIAGGHVQATTSIVGTLQAGRVNAIVALGAGNGLSCESGNRGVLRYPAGGPLQVCDQAGWVEVGGAGPGTCSIVGECPGGAEPLRAMVGDLTVRTVREATLLCSAYDEVLGALRVGSHEVDEQSTVDMSCLRGAPYLIDADAPMGRGDIDLSTIEGVRHQAQIYGRVQLTALRTVGTDLVLRDIPATSTFPALQTVGGSVGWSWASGTSETGPLVDFMPALETVGGLGTQATGPLVPLPNLVSVGDAGYEAPRVDAPNLREIGGILALRVPQPSLPALEIVGGLQILYVPSNPYLRIDPPFSLDSLSQLRRIDGALTISCVRGWESPELNAFVDRVGRENIAGTITLRPSSDPRCSDF